MITNFKNAFDRTYLRYENILNQYYPAHKSTGFTERNLTNNFVMALERELNGQCISWFEAPINLKNKAHIDAVIFTDDTTILIEAKRFTSPKSKIKNVKSDVDRMHDENSILLLETGLVTKIEKRKHFSVVLADVWTENCGKRELFDQWPRCLQGEELLYSDKVGFDGLNCQEVWKHNYKLLIAVKKITI